MNTSKRREAEPLTLIPEEIVRAAREEFGTELVALSSFGSNAGLLVSVVYRLGVPILFVNTGAIPPNDLLYKGMLEREYGFHAVDCGLATELSDQERQWSTGTEEERLLFNRIRKLEPLEKELNQRGVTAILQGIRADQNNERARLSPRETRIDGRVGIFPFWSMTTEEAAVYLQRKGMPRHPDGLPGSKKGPECRVIWGLERETS